METSIALHKVLSRRNVQDDIILEPVEYLQYNDKRSSWSLFIHDYKYYDIVMHLQKHKVKVKLYNARRDLVYWKHDESSPFDIWGGISLHSAEQFNSTVFIHRMGPQSNHKLGAPDHGLLTDVFLRHLLLHLMKGDKQFIEPSDHKK